MKKTLIKIMTMVLALAMCMSLCGVAFAVGEGEEDNAPAEIVIENDVQQTQPDVASFEQTLPEEKVTQLDPVEIVSEVNETEKIVSEVNETEEKVSEVNETEEIVTEVIDPEIKEPAIKSSKIMTLGGAKGTDPDPEEKTCEVCGTKYTGETCPNTDKHTTIECPICHTKYTGVAGTTPCPNTDNHKNWNWLWYPTDPCDGVEILNKDLAAIGGNTITYTVRPTQSAYYATGVIVTDLTTGEEYNLPIEPSITGWGTVNFKVPNDTTGAQHVYTVRPVQGFSPYAAYIYGCYPLGYGCYPTSYCGRVPKTGDDANLGLWAVLMTMSAASLAGVYFCAKKNKG